jgi:hypothetical protein
MQSKAQKVIPPRKIANIGASIGGGFERTLGLKPMKYKKAIN